MKHIAIATVLAMMLGLAALAQTSTPAGSQPSGQGTSASSQPQASPSQSPDMSSSGSQNAANMGTSEKKLKGCIESAGGKYVLEDKHGKQVPLSGSQDLASHVGHTVTLHGTYARSSDNSSAASSTASSSSGTSTAGEEFVVSKLDMVSESCNIGKEKSSKDHDTSKPNPYHK